MQFLEKHGEDLGEIQDRGKSKDRFQQRRSPPEESDKTDQSDDEEDRESERQEREEEEQLLGAMEAPIRKEILTRNKTKDINKIIKEK